MRLFLDANILFSAAWKPDAHANLLFRFQVAGRCRLISSRLAVEEAFQNLLRKGPKRLVAFAERVGDITIGREPLPQHLERAAGYGLPSKDVPILAAAIAGEANWLVTGDQRDFGHLFGQTVESVEIIRLSNAVAWLSE